MDAVNGITLDVVTNAEWASDQIVTYKAPDRKFSIQYHNELAYHCAEQIYSRNQSAPTTVRHNLPFVWCIVISSTSKVIFVVFVAFLQ